MPKKACAYCGRIHDRSFDCGKKPARSYRRRDEESGRYSWAFRLKSQEMKKKSLYLCEYCLSIGEVNFNNLEVHHITKLVDAPDLLLDSSNLICLCVKHHKMADCGEIKEDVLREIATRREQGPPRSMLINFPANASTTAPYIERNYSQNEKFQK